MIYHCRQTLSCLQGDVYNLRKLKKNEGEEKLGSAEYFFFASVEILRGVRIICKVGVPLVKFITITIGLVVSGKMPGVQVIPSTEFMANG